MTTHNKTSIVKHSLIKSIHGRGYFLSYDEQFFPLCQKEMFNPEYWQQANAVTGQAQGRGITWFLHAGNNELVLRHFYRGGLVGRFIKDKFFYSGKPKCRAYREFYLLREMYMAGLPVPRPAAFLIKRSGPFYTNDVLLERLPNTCSMVDILSINGIPKECWYSIGKTIRAFHDLNINHHDLNSHNILIDHNYKVWLIDFDQGCKCEHEQKWKENNLLRLKRSLLKERHRQPEFFWDFADWDKLMEGYHSGGIKLIKPDMNFRPNEDIENTTTTSPPEAAILTFPNKKQRVI